MTNNDSCVICLDEIENDINKNTIVLKCFHHYHYDCFIDYMKYNLQKIKKKSCIECPMCRINTENIYILHYLLDKIYNIKNEIRFLNKKKHNLSNALLYINFKKFLWLGKKKELFIEEEELMSKIEFYNKELYNIDKKTQVLRKIYYNLVNNTN